MMARAVSKDSFKVVKPRRLYEQIAEQIVALINSEQVKPGDRLPAERELSVYLGVGRPSVREALIWLEARGLIRVKPGDGAFVQPAVADTLRVPLVNAADPGPGPLEQLEARLLIEPHVASLAANLCRPEEIDELAAILEELRGVDLRGEQAVQLRYRFHTRLAALAGNSFLSMTVRQLWDLRADAMWQTLRSWKPDPVPSTRPVDAREKIVAALRKRDAKGAGQAMRKMIEDVRSIYFNI